MISNLVFSFCLILKFFLIPYISVTRVSDILVLVKQYCQAAFET